MADQRSPELDAYLERILVPLLDPDRALAFLRQAAGSVIGRMEADLHQAARLVAKDLRRRVDDLRSRIATARSTEELMRLNDPVVAPAIVLDPNSDIWQEWPREDLRQALEQAQEAYQRVQQLARTARPGSLLAHQYQEEARSLNKHLVDVQRHVLEAWLDHVEATHAQESQDWKVEWEVETRLQVPLVVEGQVMDFLDARVTVTARTPRALVLHAFAVLVLPPKTALISALRRVQVIRHFLSPEEHIVVIVGDPALTTPLQQHGVFVITAHEALAVLEQGG